MRARLKDGTADGLELDIRGDQDPRPGATPGILAVITVVEITGRRVPLECPTWADQQMRDGGDGQWTEYTAPDPGKIPPEQIVDLWAANDE